MTGILLLSMVVAVLGWAFSETSTDDETDDVTLDDQDDVLDLFGLEKMLDVAEGDTFDVQIIGSEHVEALPGTSPGSAAARIAGFDPSEDMVTIEITDGPDTPGRNFDGIELVQLENGGARIELTYDATDTSPASTATILLEDVPGITVANILVLTRPIWS